MQSSIKQSRWCVCAQLSPLFFTRVLLPWTAGHWQVASKTFGQSIQVHGRSSVLQCARHTSVRLLVLQTKEDEELTGALDSLDVSLKENIQLLSSFEKYKKEVLGDSLDWTPMHTSQQVSPLILALI